MKNFLDLDDTVGLARMICGSDLPPRRMKIVKEKSAELRGLFYDFQKIFGTDEIKLSFHPNFSSGFVKVVLHEVSLDREQLSALSAATRRHGCNNISIDTNLKNEISISSGIHGLFEEVKE